MAIWNTVSWDSGDIITKVKMNQMTGNTAFLKEHGSDFITIFAGNAIAADQLGTAKVKVRYGGAAGAIIAECNADTNRGPSGGTDSWTNIDISGEANGLEKLVFDFDSGRDYRTFRFVKGENMNYLSIWLTVYAQYVTNGYYGVYGVTIIAHKDYEGSWV